MYSGGRLSVNGWWVGDLVWMDSKHTPNDVPYKLTARWFGPLKVLEV